MKYILGFILLITSESKAQKSQFEANYFLEIKGKFNPNNELIDSFIKVTADLKIIANVRFTIVIIENSTFQNKMIKGSITEEGDTLLFDKELKRAYDLKKEKQYYYIQRTWNNTKDFSATSLIHIDTLITLNKKINKIINPTPTLPNFQYGVESYRTRNYTFMYKNSKKNNLKIKRIYDRVKKYKYEGEKIEFIY